MKILLFGRNDWINFIMKILLVGGNDLDKFHYEDIISWRK